jgi:RNA polymerase sigma-70 factor (ECF subfamily)
MVIRISRIRPLDDHLEEAVMSITGHSIEFDDQVLAARAARGSLEAFNELILRCQDMAYRHALALLRDPDLAEDASQEGFIKAFQAIRAYRGGSFRAWLLKIVTNTAYDFMRRSRRHPSEPLFPADEYGEEIEAPAWIADPSPSVESAIERSQLSERIHSILDGLPRIYREVLTLVDINELDYAEAAQALGVPIGTVRSRLARARLQVSASLAREGWDRRGASAFVVDGRATSGAGAPLTK